MCCQIKWIECCDLESCWSNPRNKGFLGPRSEFIILVNIYIYIKDFIYLFLERGGQEERDRER